MAKSKIGQERPHASVISALAEKLLSPEGVVQDFPDPLSLYSLYSVISQKQRCNEMPGTHFRPFKGRECLEEDDTWGDHSYWVRILGQLLGGRLVYANSIHRAKLTGFGEHMYPALMNGFLSLYEQNQRLEALKASWRAKHGDSDF
jgi:hypothetical protein